MPAFLLTLLLPPLALPAGGIVCDNQFNRQKALCLKEACPHTGSQAIDKADCQRTCYTIAASETRLVGDCSMYQNSGAHEKEHTMPQDIGQKASAPTSSSTQSNGQKYEANAQSSVSSQASLATQNSVSSQTQAQESATSIASQGQHQLQREEAAVSEVKETGRKIRQDSIQRNKQLIGRWEKELSAGASQNFPLSRAKLENDRKLNQEAEKLLARNEPFEKEKAEQAASPAIRSNLIFSSRGQELESKAGVQLANIATALAQLVSAKQASQKSGNALDSFSPNATYRPGGQGVNARPSAGESMKERANISAKKKSVASEERETTPEAAGKNFAGSGAAPGLRGSLRARLRELLQKRASGKATPQEIAELASLQPEEMPESFQGDLGKLQLAGGAEGADDPFLSDLSKNAFGMSGSETDAAIGSLHRELARGELDQLAGVLPAESLSLFERVKAAHDSCAAKKCVARADTVAEN
jgi:hypothetical protein